jgi:hypothetical protein
LESLDNSSHPVGNPEYRSLSAVGLCPLIASLTTLNLPSQAIFPKKIWDQEDEGRLAVSLMSACSAFLIKPSSLSRNPESLANCLTRRKVNSLFPKFNPAMCSGTFDRQFLEGAFRGSYPDSFVFSSHHLPPKWNLYSSQLCFKNIFNVDCLGRRGAVFEHETRLLLGSPDLVRKEAINPCRVQRTKMW